MAGARASGNVWALLWAAIWSFRGHTSAAVLEQDRIVTTPLVASSGASETKRRAVKCYVSQLHALDGTACADTLLPERY